MNRDITLFRHCALLIGITVIYFNVNAQDTLRMTLSQAEQQFMQQNLLLIAENYHIDIAKAEVIQARLYNNPTLELSGNAYNPGKSKMFDINNRSGQYVIGVQQLITLAGKRYKQLKLAQTNVQIAEHTFFDLLRTLSYTLRSNFYKVYYLQQSYSACLQQIQSLEELKNAHEQLLTKGLVTLKDVIRIKSLLYTMKAEQSSLLTQINELQGELQLLLHNTHNYIDPVIEHTRDLKTENLILQNLIDTAFTYRYDLKNAATGVLYNELDHKLQKAKAVPDMTIGGNFDKRSDYADNVTNLTLAIDLPFFNRNQGNIKASKIAIEQSKIYLEQQKMTVESQVRLAYTNVLNINKVLQSVDPAFSSQFEKLLKGVTDNFKTRNISLLELADFYESYKDNILQLNQLLNDREQAIEHLQFAIGRNIIR